MKKVYMLPKKEDAERDDSNSINQIVLRLDFYLSMHGWKITSNKDEADIVATHAGTGQDTYCDVAHVHGFYPTAHHNYNSWNYATNARVRDNVLQATEVTVPSQWVADIVRRDFNVEPTIVNWAIDPHDWGVSTRREHYLLWNKTRLDPVCDPKAIHLLAEGIPNVQILSTFIDSNISTPSNLKQIGRMPFEEMKKYIKNCSIYLSTVMETFGIGTLEAMACGKPVLGYDWGGTSDIIEHGIDGYLVQPGDIEGLIEGYHWCMDNYDILSYNARKKAIGSHYTWDRVTTQIAEVYDRVYHEKNKHHPPVSIIIPCHNYSEYLPTAVHSVMAQETDFSFETIIIDDKSTDNTIDVALQLAHNYEDNENPLMVLSNKTNLGVANTRNKGIEKARGKYIVCLDADDALGSPKFLQILKEYLDANPLVGIAYTGLGTFMESLDKGISPSGFPSPFEEKKILEGHNQIPTCNMFRKKAWRVAGKYKDHYIPAEDANLWMGMHNYGYKAYQVTPDPIFYYRLHSNSLSTEVRTGKKKEPDWSAAWIKNTKVGIANISPSSNPHSHPSKNYDKPLVSIVIPVSDKHNNIYLRAVDSVLSQTVWEWECIVVDDTSNGISVPYEWVKLVRTRGKEGAGKARNLGTSIAKGIFVVYLDADDYLHSEFLEKTLIMYKLYKRYIYTNWFAVRSGEVSEIGRSREYNQGMVLRGASLHPITTLIPRRWILDIGGFDEDLPSWEDKDFFIQLAVHGYCGYLIADPLLYYDYDRGERRELALTIRDDLNSIFIDKYKEWREGDKEMCRCTELVNELKKRNKSIGSASTVEGMVKVQMVSGQKALAPVVGATTKTRYARRKVGDIFYMYPQDVESEPQKYVVVEGLEEFEILKTPIPDAPRKVV